MGIPDAWAPFYKVSRPQVEIVHIMPPDLLFPELGEQHCIEHHGMGSFKPGSDPNAIYLTRYPMFREYLLIEVGRIQRDLVLALPSSHAFDQESFRAAILRELGNEYTNVQHELVSAPLGWRRSFHGVRIGFDHIQRVLTTVYILM